MTCRQPKLDNVRRYWRRRVTKLEAALKSEREAHAITRSNKLVAVQSDPRVPKGTMYVWAPGDAL